MTTAAASVISPAALGAGAGATGIRDRGGRIGRSGMS